MQPFLNRHKISREIASAIVDQQMLGHPDVARQPLKKRIIPPLPPVDVKPKKVKQKQNTEKKLITNLVMMSLKQQQGATIGALPGIGVSKFPTPVQRRRNTLK